MSRTLWASTVKVGLFCGALLVAGAAPLSAQSNIEVNQGVQIDFLNPGARSLAMGGAFVGLADDATAALANPAGLRRLSRSEFSVEGRFRDFQTPFVAAGRLAGTPANIGRDTTSFPDIRTAESNENSFSFISGVYASGDRRWALAGYRHETVRFSTGYNTEGPFSINESGQTVRRFPIRADMALKLENYGGSASFKWQSCTTPGGVQTCTDRFAIGGGVNYYRFETNGKTQRYRPNRNLTGFIPNSTAPGGFYGPPAYDQGILNYQEQLGDDTDIGFTVGALVIPTERFQVGAAYRTGAAFGVTVQNYSGITGLPFNQEIGSRFNLPQTFSAGAAVRPAPATVIVFEYKRVFYSDLLKDYLNVFSQSDPDPADLVSSFLVPDVDELHFGFEHQFVNVRIGPAIRFGAWYDPDHALQNISGRKPYLAGEDVWHYSAGGGATFGRLEVGAGFDFSDRGNICSLSAVVRF